MSTQPAPKGGVLQQTVPWSKTASWVVVLIESLVLIAAGIYILVDPQVSAQTIAWVLGIYFLVSSAMRVFIGLRNEPSEATKLSMLRGGVGLTVGVLATLQPWLHTLDVAAALVIVGRHAPEIGQQWAGEPLVSVPAIGDQAGAVELRRESRATDAHALASLLDFQRRQSRGDRHGRRVAAILHRDLCPGHLVAA